MTRLLGEVGHLLRWYGQNDQGDEASDEYDARVLDVCFADTEATSFGRFMTWHGSCYIFYTSTSCWTERDFKGLAS